MHIRWAVGGALMVSAIALVAPRVFAGPADNLSGYAWSSNVGWISFNSVNAAAPAPLYGVRVDLAGKITGYAWSSNIGWISFNADDLAGCPKAPCAATLDRVRGEVKGWARALSYGDGWDGWVSLKGFAADGSPYGVSVSSASGSPGSGSPGAGSPGCLWGGWAWGEDVVGWVSFAGSGYGVRGTGDACPRLPECSDLMDNDADGRIDYPADPGCVSAEDDMELDVPPPECRDLRDNDADGLIDFSGGDPGCVSPDDPSELDPPIPECRDSRDNDGDEKIDFPADPGCTDADDRSESDKPKIIEISPL